MNRRNFLGAMAAFGISINTPVIFGQDTSNSNKILNNDNDKTFGCDVEQPISTIITTIFDNEQIFRLGQLSLYEEPQTILELIYKNRTEKYKVDKFWIDNCKPPIGIRRLPENNNTIYLLKTKDIFTIYAKHDDSWIVCELTIEERIDEKT